MSATPEPVVWSEGLLMAPQHLQQSDRYHERRLAARLDALEPLNWGVLHLEFDRSALGRGEIGLQEFVGILPGGTPLTLGPTSAEKPGSREIQPCFAASQSTVGVYLALPRERSDATSFGSSSEGRCRYIVTARSVPDLVTESSDLEVAFGAWNVSLRFGSEDNREFETLKIGELTRDAGGTFGLCARFIPASLRLGASRRMVSLVTDLLEGLQRARQSLLPAVSARSAALRRSDVTAFLRLNVVNSFIPVLRHMASAQDLHPRSCYLILCQLIGHLTTFASGEEALEIPPFSYLDLAGTFEPLAQQIAKLLSATVPEVDASILLAARPDGVHEGSLSATRLANARRAYLGVSSHLGVQEASNQIPRLAKIASTREIESVLAAATPGVTLAPCHTPPAEVPLRSGVAYFELSTGCEGWQRIVAEGDIAVHLPHPFVPPQTAVELFASEAQC